MDANASLCCCCSSASQRVWLSQRPAQHHALHVGPSFAFPLFILYVLFPSVLGGTERVAFLTNSFLALSICFILHFKIRLAYKVLLKKHWLLTVAIESGLLLCLAKNRPLRKKRVCLTNMESVQPQLHRNVILWPAVQKALKNILMISQTYLKNTTNILLFFLLKCSRPICATKVEMKWEVVTCTRTSSTKKVSIAIKKIMQACSQLWMSEIYVDKKKTKKKHFITFKDNVDDFREAIAH